MFSRLHNIKIPGHALPAGLLWLWGMSAHAAPLPLHGGSRAPVLFVLGLVGIALGLALLGSLMSSRGQG